MVKQLLFFLVLALSAGCYAVVPPEPQPIVKSKDVTLVWTPPPRREDDTLLAPSEISHYEIFYGLASDTGSATMINVGKVESYVIPGLTGGDWQFWMWTVDTDGATSELSTELNVTIVTQSRPVAPKPEIN